MKNGYNYGLYNQWPREIHDVARHRKQANPASTIQESIKENKI